MRPIFFLSLFALSACTRGGDEEPVDADGDSHTDATDCNDSDPTVFPGAVEVCNGVDDDCSGVIDNAPSDASTFYLDADGDGFGSAADATTACDTPARHTSDSTDCDDSDPTYFPGATEDDCTDPNDYNCDGSSGFADVDGDGFAACLDCNDTSADVSPDGIETCDGIDNDCDGGTDEGGATDETTWYADDDGDGYGDPLQTVDSCDQPTGYINDSSDCNDSTDTAHPGAAESCDGLDNDCDGDSDEPDATDALDWHADGDADGFGDPGILVHACSAPPGFVSDDTDCDDDADTSYPGASESCDEADNNCDGAVDEGHDKTWYIDYDGDGYGKSNVSVTDCSRPNGFSSTSDDCDDLNTAINPGATQACNGIDDDCSGLPSNEADDDSDGFFICENDCDDTQSSVNPDATEVWYDGIDQDCDGANDNDQDGDGHEAEAQGGDDCDDLDASTFDVCDDGTDQAAAGLDCKQISDDHSPGVDGHYWVDPDGDGDPSNAFEAWCDMTTDGGGWMLVANLTNRWAPAHTAEHFFLESLIQTSAAWTDNAGNTVALEPAVNGIIKVDTYSAPAEIKYQMIEVSTLTVQNEVLFTGSSSIDHLQQYDVDRQNRTGSATGASLAHGTRTYYLGSDNDAIWHYWGGIFGRSVWLQDNRWQFGLSVNKADGVSGYNGTNDDQNRAQFNLGVAANSPSNNTDISSYWAGVCTSSCNENNFTSFGANAAQVYVWHR